MLNHHHSFACEGCAGWRVLYEESLRLIGQRNMEKEMLETRVELVTLEHARDRRDLRRQIGELRDTMADIIVTARQVIEPLWARIRTRLQGLTDSSDFIDWMDPNQPAPPRIVSDAERLAREIPPVSWEQVMAAMEGGTLETEGERFPRGGLGRMYGPGPRSGHLRVPMGKEMESPMRRKDLPGMVSGTEGHRVVMCGSQCREGHTYSLESGCLYGVARDPEQQQRHPKAGEGPGPDAP